MPDLAFSAALSLRVHLLQCEQLSLVIEVGHVSPNHSSRSIFETQSPSFDGFDALGGTKGLQL